MEDFAVESGVRIMDVVEDVRNKRRR